MMVVVMLNVAVVGGLDVVEVGLVVVEVWWCWEKKRKALYLYSKACTFWAAAVRRSEEERVKEGGELEDGGQIEMLVGAKSYL